MNPASQSSSTQPGVRASRLLAGMMGLWLASASAQSVRVTEVSPGSIRPGITNRLVLSGEKVSPGQMLLTSLGLESWPGESVPGGVEFRLPVPVDCPEGVLFARVCGPEGVSPPFLLAVDRLPTLAQFRSATNLTLARFPMAVEGRNPAGSTNHFRFSLRRGETIDIEILARRLGSTLDPWISIEGPEGQQELACEDSPGLQGDLSVAYTARQSGPFELCLRDSDFDGGPRGEFRLRVTRRTRDSNASWEPLAFLTPPDHAPGVTSGEAYPLKELPRGVPGASPVQVPVPARIRGTLPSGGKRRVLEFEMAQPGKLRATFRSRDLGSRGDVGALWEDATGTLLAEMDATRSEDGMTQHEFNAPGTYRLVVWELSGAGGPLFPFECQLGPGGDDVQLAVDQHSVELPPGGRATLQVTATRRGYEGPVELRVAGLPPDWPESRATLPAKAKEVTLELHAPASARAAEAHAVAVIGEFPANGQARIVRASNRTALRKVWPDLLTPPPSLDGVLCLGVTAGPKSSPRTAPASAAAAAAQAGLRP